MTRDKALHKPWMPTLRAAAEREKRQIPRPHSGDRGRRVLFLEISCLGLVKRGPSNGSWFNLQDEQYLCTMFDATLLPGSGAEELEPQTNVTAWEHQDQASLCPEASLTRKNTLEN